VKLRQISKAPLLFYAEVALAGMTGFLYVATPYCPDWIEAISGWDPDQHKGSIEWVIVMVLLMVTLAVINRVRSLRP
jgi:hypothetical protein